MVFLFGVIEIVDLVYGRILVIRGRFFVGISAIRECSFGLFERSIVFVRAFCGVRRSFVKGLLCVG